MAALLGLLVRWIHVVGMALLVGGAALVWGQFRFGTDGPADATRTAASADAALQLAATYEWLFWGAAGAVVLTGVGNLGSMAPAVPGPATAWGLTFTIKLVAVLGLLGGSVVRTLAVVRARGGGDGARGHGAVLARLGAVYAATAGYLLAIVALAEVLAHG